MIQGTELFTYMQLKTPTPQPPTPEKNFLFYKTRILNQNKFLITVIPILKTTPLNTLCPLTIYM